MAATTSEWAAVTPTTLERQLKGAEYLVNVSDHQSDGNFQLILTLSFEANVSHETLKKRFAVACLRARHRHPLLGVSFPADRLDTAIFSALQTPENARHWLGQSSEIVQRSGVSVNDMGRGIAKRCLPTPDRTSKMYLLLGDNGQSAMSLHTSHAMTGHYSGRVLDFLCGELIQDDAEQSLESIFTLEDVVELRPRLPASLESAYRARFQPTQADFQEEIARRQQLAAIEQQRPRIGLSTCENPGQRPSDVHNIRVSFAGPQAKAIRAGVRRAGATPTSALFACIVKAMASEDLQPDNVQGAMLNFPTHASRWLPCYGEDGGATIAMAIVPSAVWVDCDGDVAAQSTATLAKSIDAAQKAFLQTPHLMAFSVHTAETVKELLRSTTPDAASLTPLPQATRSNAVLTSQGVIPMARMHASRSGPSSMRITDYCPLGRNTDPTVCFVLYSLAEAMHVAVIFDGRYFDRQHVDNVLTRTASLFAEFAEATTIKEATARL